MSILLSRDLRIIRENFMKDWLYPREIVGQRKCKEIENEKKNTWIFQKKKYIRCCDVMYSA